MLSARLADLGQSLRTLPSPAVWRRCLIVLVAFVVCALPLGYATGVVQPGRTIGSPLDQLRLGLLLAVYPAFAEELIFRGLLLPRQPARRSSFSRVAIASLALAAYVLSHPLNAWLFRPDAWPIFSSPGYLACVALLGTATTIAYWMSGSIWPPVLMHWITAAAWILWLGGPR